MSSAEKVSIHPSLKLIFPQDITEDSHKLDGSINADKEDLDPNAAWKFYSHSIRRDPSDLKLHTHRVFFAMQHKESAFLAGSLHDLFYVLKDAGKNLRIRLLKASIPHLSKQEVLYFAMWIKTGIKKGMGYKWLNGSVLSDGLFGPDNSLITITKPSDEEEYTLTPLEEARDYMESGQLEKAKSVLEEALESDKDNESLLEELDYLVQYIKSREITPPDESEEKKIKNRLSKWKEKLSFKKQVVAE